ncbi:MAG: DHA2 family efflux MFS transporter permease subunit [Coriobacteriia bacterium]|nr:DHA2 family efflux MFS transporter permease subunit [Coriobacteriia bacterium]
METAPKSNLPLYLMFAVVVLTTAMGNLSQTAVSSMLTAVDADFGITAGTGQWLTTIYMLVLGITVPAVTFLSRRFCTRQLMLIALALFLAGSVAGLLASSFPVMFAGRVLQAVSAGITMPLVQAIAQVRFPAGQKATAMGVAGIALGFAPNIGPVLGGIMADAWGWRSFFVLLLALSALLVVAALAVIPREDGGVRTPFDGLSFVFSTLGFGGVLLAFSNASGMGLTSVFVLGPLLVGAVFVVLFLTRQRRVDNPLINLDIFQSQRFRSTFVVQNALTTSYMGITLVVPLYVQGLCGGTAVDAGLVFVPATVAALFVNPVCGVLTDRLGVRPVALFGGVCMAVGAVAMVPMDAQTPLWYPMLFQGIRGVGMGALIGPTMSYGLSELPRGIAMDGSSFIVLVRQACASLGTAVMVAIIYLVLGSADAWGVSEALAYQGAFGFSAVFALVMLAVIVLRIR